jgi:uncharacterized repeat protein (TIGR01451 family)
MSFRRLYVLLFVPVAIVQGQAQTPIVKAYGIDFSPYETGQDPNLGSQVTAAQILSRMQVVAPYTVWIRSFGSTGGLENTPSAGRQLGLKVAANAWISSDLPQNALEIANLIAAANAGLVDVAIVGSEAILRNDVTVAQLIAYMNQVRQAIPSGIPVTTADVWGTFVANPSLIAASDQVWANFYPYWEGTSISDAQCSLEQEYQRLAQASGSKAVVVSETGWPTAGNAVGAAVPSVGNATLFALQFLTWASANNIQSFYFEAFNEDWKTDTEGLQGANWGIWDENAAIKPGMNEFFDGQTSSVACNGTIPGSVGIAPVYVPPYGSSDSMEVQVTGVQPAGYDIATYIDVFGGWWTKPTFAQPTVAIIPDGTARLAIDTGGSDYDATEIEAFLIPSGSQPPAASGGGKPTPSNYVASFDVGRTQSSISGTITDSHGNPITGAAISSAVLGSTTSAPDGKYSFYNITTTGNATISAAYPNYVFSPPSATLTISNGNQIVPFTGTATVDLSVAASVSPNPVSSGSAIVDTVVVSNAGPASATDAVLALTIPASFTSFAVSTTRGSCNATAQPVTCDLGGLAAQAYATVTVNATAGNAGSYAFGACVSGPDPDSDTSNICTSQPVTVLAPILSITKTHAGSFSQGQNGATYTVTVSNTAGAGASNGTVTVTETAPAGETLISMAGNGWTCPGGNTCTRGDALAGGTSYPAIAVTVNVAGNAATPQVNSVTVSGGGSASATVTDSTVVNVSATPLGTLTAASTMAAPGSASTIPAGVCSYTTQCFLVAAGQFRIPIGLSLNNGISVNSLTFAIQITANGGAPALAGPLGFTAASAITNTPVVNTASAPNTISVLWSALTTPLSGTGTVVGTVTGTLPASAASGQTYSVAVTGVSATNVAVSVPLAVGANGTLTVAPIYLGGDVAPYTTDAAGHFGDGVLNILDLIQELFAVNNVGGYTPSPCSDRLDTMDLFPADTAGVRGGDGLLDIRDLILELFRSDNLDPSRPVRGSRGGCRASGNDSIGAPETARNGTAAARPGGAAQGALALGSAERGSGGTERIPVYLEARQDLAQVAVTFALGDQRSQLRFVAGAAAPSLTQDSQLGVVAAAWLDGVSVRAGERLLLGFVEGPTGVSANLRVYGASASGVGDNREVRLDTPGKAGAQ